jgi:hypothetical protein
VFEWVWYCLVFCSFSTGFSTGMLVPSVANVPFILLLIFSNNLLYDVLVEDYSTSCFSSCWSKYHATIDFVLYDDFFDRQRNVFSWLPIWYSNDYLRIFCRYNLYVSLMKRYCKRRHLWRFPYEYCTIRTSLRNDFIYRFRSNVFLRVFLSIFCC